MQDKPVVGVFSESFGDQTHQSVLDLDYVLARGNTGSVCNAKNMCVHRDSRFTESRIKHHIGSLAPHAGKPLEFFTSPRDLASMFRLQNLTSRDDVLGLVSVQADALDEWQ